MIYVHPAWIERKPINFVDWCHANRMIAMVTTRGRLILVPNPI